MKKVKINNALTQLVVPIVEPLGLKLKQPDCLALEKRNRFWFSPDLQKRKAKVIAELKGIGAFPESVIQWTRL